MDQDGCSKGHAEERDGRRALLTVDLIGLGGLQLVGGFYCLAAWKLPSAPFIREDEKRVDFRLSTDNGNATAMQRQPALGALLWEPAFAFAMPTLTL